MTELKISWGDFIREINSLYKQGNSLLNSKPKTINDEESFISDYNTWREKITNYWEVSFGLNNSYSSKFKYNRAYIKSHQRNSSQIDLVKNKQLLKGDLHYIE